MKLHVTVTSKVLVTARTKSMLRRKNRLMRALRVEEALQVLSLNALVKPLWGITEHVSHVNNKSGDVKDLGAAVRQQTGKRSNAKVVEGTIADSLNSHYAIACQRIICIRFRQRQWIYDWVEDVQDSGPLAAHSTVWMNFHYRFYFWCISFLQTTHMPCQSLDLLVDRTTSVEANIHLHAQYQKFSYLNNTVTSVQLL